MSFVVLNERDKNTKEHFKYELTPESSATSSVEWGHPGHKLRITKKKKNVLVKENVYISPLFYCQ